MRTYPGVLSFMYNKAIYIRCHEDGHILGYKDWKEALDDIEAAFSQAIDKGQKSRERAILGMLLYDPRSHSVSNERWLKGNIIVPPFRVDTFGVRGREIFGILCVGRLALSWHKAGRPPGSGAGQGGREWFQAAELQSGERSSIGQSASISKRTAPESLIGFKNDQRFS